jgi:hypothetical protein
MCDANTESLIKTAVNGFVQKGYMFSAFDVTRFLRKGGERIRHNDTKDVVTEMFSNSEMGMYVRATKDIGAPVAPFIYSHPYSDISNYSADWVDTNPNQVGMCYDMGSSAATPMVSAVPVSSPAPVAPAVPASKLPDGVYKTTDEGRLNIPIHYVQNIINTPCVNIYQLNGGLSILPSSTPSYSAKVNKDGRIRLSRSTLDKISDGELFKIEVKNNEIFVTPA